ncbi:MAG: sulfurtransferase [Proteobacteria bacterium]|nr:sulfurtransferase [Pseudomonadota bacterium]MBT6658056.1 sulfurtransferase [Pseudomonadota bacterium]MBT7671952.1 sulfurtransferase [Pseudomonadota bacterium]
MLEEGVRRFGEMGPLFFIGVYAVGTAVFLPGSIMTLAGGAMFGPVWGVLYSLTGATIGAIIAFLISRYLAADWVEQKASSRVRRLKSGVEAEGWRFIAFVRLVPLLPFNILNYALGLTHIRISHYIFATFFAMAPGAVAYTYIGFAGRELIAGGEGLIQKGLLAIGLLALAVFLPGFIKRLRQNQMLDVHDLNERLLSGQDMLILDVRSRDEFMGEYGHIPQSLNIPLPELDTRVDELFPYLDRPVVIVCRSHKRSGKAARILEREGFNDFQVVREGMTAWVDASFAVALD